MVKYVLDYSSALIRSSGLWHCYSIHCSSSTCLSYKKT